MVDLGSGDIEVNTLDEGLVTSLIGLSQFGLYVATIGMSVILTVAVAYVSMRKINTNGKDT